MRILILGGAGMLGHTLFSYLSGIEKWDVYTTTRSTEGLKAWLPEHLAQKVRTGVDADNFNTFVRALASIRPDVVINCIGLIKQLPLASDPLTAITVNSQFPHRISLICRSAGARLIHMSTDCVFDGKKGNYTETDPLSADDLYGRTKYLGEVAYPHCITLRTSIIGHELKGFHGLIEWFLKQENHIKGYTNAIFSGFPTIEIANIISNYILPDEQLQGIYHVASQPISKYALLKLVADKYSKNIVIEPCDEVKIDRSLDASRFKFATRYSPPAWPELVEKMHDNFLSSPHYKNRKY
jgi:dTDP-4-dehydrorhamnose reductase